MTDSHTISPELMSQYTEGWIDFKGLILRLMDLGHRPREAYKLARDAEQGYMQAIATRGWEKQDG